jgi:hypothetical protein
VSQPLIATPRLTSGSTALFHVILLTLLYLASLSSLDSSLIDHSSRHLTLRRLIDITSKCFCCNSHNEEERRIRIEAVQNFIDAQMEKIRDRIGIITDGWTPPMTCEDTLKQNWHVKNEAFEREDDGTRKENIQNRPFDDHEG